MKTLGRTADRIALTRGTIGAAQSRIGFAERNLNIAAENYAAAESSIRDADIAADAARLASLKILQQAGTAILAQANQQPSLALKLLEIRGLPQ